MGQNVHIPISASYDGAPVKKAEDDVKKLGQSAENAGGGAKELTHDLGEVSKAAKGTGMISHGLAELFHGNLLGAIKNVSKGLKLLWAAMLENPITGIIALVGLLAPLLFKLAGAFGAGSDAADKQAAALKKLEAEAEASAKELEKLNKAKLDEAIQSAKDLADEWERAVKAAHELQAAADKLTSAQMAQELAGNEAAMQAELAAAGGDKDAERRIKLKYAGSESEIRNRYAKKAADEELGRAVGERSAIDEEARKSREGAAGVRGEAKRAEADRKSRAEELQNYDIWDKNGNLDPEKAKSMQAGLNKMAQEQGSMLAAQTSRRIGEYQAAADAAAAAKKKADDAEKADAVRQNELNVKRDAATTGIETAKMKQRAASSSSTASGTAQSNEQRALEAQIAEEHRREQERRDQERLRASEQQQRLAEQQQRAALAASQRNAQAGLREYGAASNQPGMPSGMSQAIHHRMQTLGAAVGGGDTAVIAALEAYHQSIQRANRAQISAMDKKLRELAAKIEATTTHSGN
jgi:hypothetical protein